MPAALEFQSTSKHFGAHAALDSLSLTLERGEILGFLGPNGAGKTTAIHLALGFLRPTEGGGVILGRPFGDTATRARIGFLPDSPSFFAGSANAAVELAGRLNNTRNPRLRERSRELLSQLNLASAGKDARRFSRGLQQRLGMAQALVNDPDLLILDEPTSALDPPGVLEVRELLKAARSEGKSIFFSSHQLSEVEQVCDRIAFLDHGRLLRHGPLASFLEDSGRMEVVIQGLPADAEAMLQYQQFHSGSSEAGQHFVIPAHMQREFIEQIWAAGGTLKSVTPLRRTLEELFIAWSEDASENASRKPEA
ncbi:ABC transporter ATP-binding protein [Alloacidobacterium dinghuense]|uniref:ABC transporter ATP-binding protein n=1 Tax=Alloacidobacterium dinghuense TaxID=2763107 RepID=A0A7G8BM74_9BACT|nr:ABC transporter ATP-binding protein [Alloacidobacterium dinghuense]QNI33644.1 ABC transporter ATP-binding protein [Alloacidobacterium dinghuense]